MNICLIGNGLASLALAKNLINKKIKVFVYYENTKKLKFQSRTIGISKNNFNFFNKEIIKFKKNMLWKIKQIEIYLEKYNDEKILNFEKSKEELFSIVNEDSRSNGFYLSTFSNSYVRGVIRPAGIYDEPGALSFVACIIAALRKIRGFSEKGTWIILILGLLI